MANESKRLCYTPRGRMSTRGCNPRKTRNSSSCGRRPLLHQRFHATPTPVPKDGAFAHLSPPSPPPPPPHPALFIAYLLCPAMAVHHQGGRRVEPRAAVHEGPVQLRGQVGVDRLAVKHAVWRAADDPALPASEALLRDRNLVRFGSVRAKSTKLVRFHPGSVRSGWSKEALRQQFDVGRGGNYPPRGKSSTSTGASGLFAQVGIDWHTIGIRGWHRHRRIWCADRHTIAKKKKTVVSTGQLRASMWATKTPNQSVAPKNADAHVVSALGVDGGAVSEARQLVRAVDLSHRHRQGRGDGAQVLVSDMLRSAQQGW